MYCVKCGVRLDDSLDRCPLCGTPVWRPEEAQDQDRAFSSIFPEKHRNERLTAVAFLTAVALLAAFITLRICLRIYGGIGWSGYAMLGIALFYVIAILPLWFRRPNPVIFVPVDFIAVGLYLLYINFATGGHWFLSFAFPVTGAIGLLISAAVALTHYLRGGYLYIYGGMLILGGGLAVLIEFLINLTFQIHETLFWSFYPMVAGIVLGLMLIVIAICKPLRESLHRKFFL